MLVEPMPMTDEVIREVRRVRHEISRRCDHDPRRVVAYYRDFQDELKRSGYRADAASWIWSARRRCASRWTENDRHGAI